MNKSLYDFLIEAKKQTYANENAEKVSPLRKGPYDYHYQNGEYEYNFSVIDDLNYFEGTKTIHKGKIKIYELKCYGGIIKR